MLTKAELQRLRALREKRNREAVGLFVVEGEKVVAELLAAAFPFVEIFATAEWIPPAEAASSLQRMRLTRITAAEMERASHFPTPSTVLAVGRISRAAFEPQVLQQGLTLALDGVQDAGNVGTLLRIADWFGMERVLMSSDCADLFHQKVINASMGSFARVAVHSVDLAAVLREHSHLSAATPVLGCDLTGDDVHSLPRIRDAIVVVGSEGRGLSPAVGAYVTRRVTIPRFGRAESLNAAVAAAIVCDNLRRRRV